MTSEWNCKMLVDCSRLRFVAARFRFTLRVTRCCEWDVAMTDLYVYLMSIMLPPQARDKNQLKIKAMISMN